MQPGHWGSGTSVLVPGCAELGEMLDFGGWPENGKRGLP